MNPRDPHATPHPEDFCAQCGQFLNPVQRMLGRVCGVCARDNQRRAARGPNYIDPHDGSPR
jgi:hypothetical protein